MPLIDFKMPDTKPPVIILAEPQMGENIGMVARAMANFGLKYLRLVAPRDGWPNERAAAASAQAWPIIENTQVFETLGEALHDIQYVQATTARGRDLYKPVMGPVDAAIDLKTRSQKDQKSAILFGREKWGLSNEEISLCDVIVTFPVDPACASLNIAQAVLLMSYEWLKASMDDTAALPFDAVTHPPAKRETIVSFLTDLERDLDARNYFNPIEKKPRMIDNVRSLFVRPEFSETEIQMLRGILAAHKRKIGSTKPE